MDNVYDFRVAHPEIIKQLSVRDMLFAYYKCPQVDRVLHLFSHFNEIAFTLSGKKILHHRGKAWTLAEDTSLFIRRTAYTSEKYAFEGWEILAFCFQDDFLLQVFREYRPYLSLKNLPPPPEDMLIDIYLNETTRSFFYSMVPYFSQQVSPSETLLELKFKELLFNIFADPSNTVLLAYINSIENQHKTPLLQIMEANYTYNLTVAEFARIAQRSIAAFKREFREIYHTSPGKWLTKKRLDYAKQLLETSEKKVSEIVDASGFENLTHFSRIFKERYGSSPLQHRKKINHKVTE